MNRFRSIFSPLLQLFSRIEFQQAVKETKAKRHVRGLTCWGQFVVMLFCQLDRAHSLREITGGLRSCEGKLRHLCISAPTGPLWLMPMSAGPGNSTKESLCNFSNDARAKSRPKRNSGLRIKRGKNDDPVL
jgi:hypothetical protein